jgi:outer membrane protein assembly factor BamB
VNRVGLAVAAVVLVGLVAGVVAVTVLDDGDDGLTGEFAVEWESDTARSVQGNHHPPAVGPDGGGDRLVFAPLSGAGDTDECALVALSGASGETRWTRPIPPSACTIHSVATPAVADHDADGDREVLAATTERELLVLSAATGRRELAAGLSAYGYTEPVVADLLGDATPETLVVDVAGLVHAYRPDGSLAWSRALDGYVWGRPVVADADGDGRPEVAVGLGDGRLHLLERGGRDAWDRPLSFDGAVTWTTAADLDGRAGVEVLVATDAGAVAAVGGDREVHWKRTVGRFAAVGAAGDTDDDGDPEVHVTDRSGRLRALDGATGEPEWTLGLTGDDLQAATPPRLADLDGDGDPEVVATTHDGRIHAVDDGTLVASHRVGGPLYAPPTVADLEGDGDDELLITRGDGVVVAVDWEV